MGKAVVAGYGLPTVPGMNMMNWDVREKGSSVYIADIKEGEVPYEWPRIGLVFTLAGRHWRITQTQFDIDDLSHRVMVEPVSETIDAEAKPETPDGRL